MEIINGLIVDFDKNDKIPVNEFTRDIISVGNNGKNELKIQFTYIKNDKYSIRTEPELVIIPPKHACEISIYIKPLCTTTINI